MEKVQTLDSIFDIELFNKKRNGGSKLRRWKKYIGKVLHSALKLKKHFSLAVF